MSRKVLTDKQRKLANQECMYTRVKQMTNEQCENTSDWFGIVLHRYLFTDAISF